MDSTFFGASGASAVLFARDALRPRPRHRGRHELSRSRIVELAAVYLERMEHSASIASVAALAAAADVSERTLRTAFHQCFGVGPARFLKLRQLHRVREALLHAGPGPTTVTRIVTRFGVSDFGRFAHSYKMLFGEVPSATLRGAGPLVKLRTAAPGARAGSGRWTYQYAQRGRVGTKALPLRGRDGPV